nr:hypothetical protein CFP56_70704 [Quercus suber]
MSDIRRYIRFKCNHLIDSHFLSSLSHIALFLYRKLRKVCSFCSVPHASGSDLLHVHRSSTFLQLLSLARSE